MYSLKVKKDLTTESGTIYMVGHDCKQLTAFEAAELLVKYPEHFEPADDLTADFAKDKANLQHLAEANERLRRGQ